MPGTHIDRSRSTLYDSHSHVGAARDMGPREFANDRSSRVIFKAISRMKSPVCHMLKFSGWLSWLRAGLIFILVSAWADERAGVVDHGYTKWAKGPPSDPGFFPLAVWLQAPANAERY